MNSICIATYNGEKHIHNQIASLINQIKDDDEIVISDDGSKDRTIEIIESFNDERIKIYKNRLKQGPVGNFENAIVCAKGNIIFLCDQDDIWIENKYCRHLELHSNYDLVVSDAIVIDENTNVIFQSFFKERGSKKGLFANILKNSYIGCCMSFNRKVVDIAIPFPPHIHMHDWWIGLVAEVKAKIFFLNEPLMYYIRHDNNASGTLIKTLPIKDQFKNRVGLIKSLLQLVVRNER